MGKTKIIGLTGGIGSGKSSVLQLFKNRGVSVYIADIEAKILMQTDSRIIKKIKSIFGEKAYNQGQLNRSYLAEEIFNDQNKLKQINEIVHPVVQNHFKKYLDEIDEPMVIYENAILFENGFDKLCDYILTIVAPTELKIQRVMRRDGCTEKQVTERMNNQWSDEKKIAHSHFVIENIDWKTTEKEVDRIYNVLIAEIQKDTLKNINLDFDEF